MDSGFWKKRFPVAPKLDGAQLIKQLVDTPVATMEIGDEVLCINGGMPAG